MFASLWGRLSSWIVGALGLLAAIAAVYLKGRAAGKQVEQRKVTERHLVEERAKAATVQEVHDVQTDVSLLPTADVRQRLQDKWTRDN